MRVKIARSVIFGVLAFLLTALVLRIMPDDTGPAPATVTPVVVELYTSETCPKCPEAEALLREWADNPPVSGIDIIPVAMHVDYGTLPMRRDPYAFDAAFERQRAYAINAGLDQVFTPQFVINGQPTEPAMTDERLHNLLRSAANQSLPRLGLMSSRLVDGVIHVSVSAPPVAAARADLYAVVVEDGVENTRLPLPGVSLEDHMAVARRLTPLRTFETGDLPAKVEVTMEADPQWEPANCRIVTFLQNPETMAVLAAGQVDIEEPPSGAI